MNLWVNLRDGTIVSCILICMETSQSFLNVTSESILLTQGSIIDQLPTFSSLVYLLMLKALYKCKL